MIFKDIQAIIAGCKDQHHAAQKALVDLQGDRLYAICIRYIGDRDKAKDVLQECFIRIFKYIDKFDPIKGSFETWLNVLTVRQCLKQLDKKTLKTIELSTKLYNEFYEDPKVINQMSADEILAKVESLPEGYRQVFNLAVVEGYSHKQIAKLLDLEEGSSRSKLSRAKQMMRAKLFYLKLHKHG